MGGDSNSCKSRTQCIVPDNVRQRPDLQSQSSLPLVAPTFLFIGNEGVRKDSGGSPAYACKKAPFAFLMRTDFKPV